VAYNHAEFNENWESASKSVFEGPVTKGGNVIVMYS
jgi:hypothetical protein